jgi:hypothetical protein
MGGKQRNQPHSFLQGVNLANEDFFIAVQTPLQKHVLKICFQRRLL